MLGEQSGVREAYLEQLGLLPASDHPGEVFKSEQKRFLALERAHDLRKFEIELIWKRSAYFWGIQIAAFAGIGVIGADMDSVCVKDCRVLELVSPVLLLLISTFGLAAAIAWFGVAKASKVYMVNWEKHIDLLEVEFNGDLYKTLFYRGNSESAKPMLSINGINEAISIFACFIWALAVAGSAFVMYIVSEMSILFAGFLVLVLVILASAAWPWWLGRIFTPKLVALDDISNDIPTNDGKFWRRRPDGPKQADGG